ncbi:hypothetical protein [Pygmaiobacter massiliensis]|uniref:hypothetical protein n=1 Tax=Pygmaiobacter massiliensis TaxID=1917873 RepID=UPI00289CE6F5|nr:hypothetical protein [Pygmaiobacter massiliensis]
MIYESAAIIFNYDRIDNMRALFPIVDKSLGECFTPCTILPIPDNAPDEIPRFLAQSSGGHSNLIISPVSAQLNVKFDDSYAQNWELCIAYLQEKAQSIFKTVKSIVEEHKINFSGISVVCFDLIQSETAINTLQKQIVRLNISNVCKMALRFCSKTNNNYVNIELETQPKKNIETGEDFDSIVYNVDINDKLGYLNESSNYICEADQIKANLTLLDAVVKEKLGNIVKCGDFTL